MPIRSIRFSYSYLSQLMSSSHRSRLPATLTMMVIPISSLSVSTSHAQSHIMPTVIDSDQPIKAMAVLDSLVNETSLPDFRPPQITRFETANGLSVLFYRTQQLPILDVQLTFNAGSARDNEIPINSMSQSVNDRAGLANLTAATLAKRTSSLNEDDLLSQQEALGVTIGVNSYKDMFVVSMRTLTLQDYLQPAIELLQDILQNSQPNSTIIDRQKARILSGIKQQQENPQLLANLAFYQHLYGKHPYAYPVSGTASSVNHLTDKDIEAFKTTYLVTNNATLSITGDVTLSQAKQIAAQLSKALPSGNKAPDLPAPVPLSANQSIHIEYPSTQTYVMMGQLGIKRATSPEQQKTQTALSLGNDIIGGGDFNARLMTKLRKENGLTYGVYSQFTPMQSVGPYAIAFSTRNTQLQKALSLTRQTLQDTLDQGVTSTEVTETKNAAIRQFPLGFSSNRQINSTLAMMGFYKLPDSYLDQYHQRIYNTDQKDINQALRNQIDLNRLLTITVGQKTQTE